jgi:Domain of unknown function (DUF1707)
VQVADGWHAHGMSEGDTSPLRIGNTERQSAMKALDEHLSEGRLGAEEYGDRSAIAANATTADELRKLFTDLPAPHPQLPGSSPALPPTSALPVVAPGGEVEQQRGWIDQWGPRLVAVSPFVALALFLLTRQWYFFLLVPAAGALFWGGRGQDTERERDERRDRRDERRDRRER